MEHVDRELGAAAQFGWRLAAAMRQSEGEPRFSRAVVPDLEQAGGAEEVWVQSVGLGCLLRTQVHWMERFVPPWLVRDAHR